MSHKTLYKVFIIAILFLSFNSKPFAQGVVLKTNLLCDVSGTMNLGAECSLTRKQSFSLVASYNPWEFSDNTKRKYLLVQPEYRWWNRGIYDGYFVGAQFNYGMFNIGGLLPWWVTSFDTFENNRYQGDLYGVGITTGYQWIISPKFNLELSTSTGYAHIMYDKYERAAGTPRLEEGVFNYFGVTQVGVTLVYYIR